jgi:exopolysaccharide biosynthesis protein
LGQGVKIKAGYKGYYTPGSTAETRAAAAANLPSALEIPTAVAASYASIADAEGTVVMATNADYFDVDTGEPRGCLIMEGNVIYAKNRPYFAILKDGTAVIRDAGTDYSDVAEAVSGPYYLVKDGVNVAPDTPNREPRNSVGICGDGSVVFFQNDGRQARTLLV